MTLTDLHPVWNQLLCLTAAFILSTAVGLERQVRQKSAGMRTHTLVGLGAALFMVISKFGFDDVLAVDLVRLDPSRMAAQIVSGIGFIGAGVVFTRRNRVRGLTTAASIWLTAAIGTAAGSGLIAPAAFVTAAYLLVVCLYPVIVRAMSLGADGEYTVRVDYLDGQGALRDIMRICTDNGFAVAGFTTHGGRSAELADGGAQPSVVGVELDLLGTHEITDLMSALSRADGVVGTSGTNEAE